MQSFFDERVKFAIEHIWINPLSGKREEALSALREAANMGDGDAFYFLGVTFFLGLACHTIILARVQSLWLFLYLLLIPVLTDTFAYVLGQLIGRIAVAPNISPNKTIEGCFLGSLCSTLLCSVFYLYFVSKMSFFPLFFFISCLTGLTTLVSKFSAVIPKEIANLPPLFFSSSNCLI